MEFKKLDVKKVEKDLELLISKLKMEDKLSLKWIKDFTYNFDLPTNQISEKYFGKLMNLLPKNIGEEDMAHAMQVFNDVWNCFPQKIIEGKSPQDKHFDEIGKLNNKETGTLTENEKMVKDHFEYAEKHLDEYLDWIGKEIIPKYKLYLKNHNVDKIDYRMGVVKAFLETCGRYGFFEIGNLHPMFIREFPDMFSESFVGPKISKEKISIYLNDFINFISIYYPAIQ
ncbi:MAG: hypothetical protein WC849_03195 [Candidatus Paceibacterota bacterium]